MTKLIGDPERFAIEFSVDEPRVEHWMFGKLCYQAGRRLIGNYEFGCSLNAGVAGFVDLLHFKGARFDEKLLKLPSRAAFRSNQ